MVCLITFESEFLWIDVQDRHGDMVTCFTSSPLSCPCFCDANLGYVHNRTCFLNCRALRIRLQHCMCQAGMFHAEEDRLDCFPCHDCEDRS